MTVKGLWEFIKSFSRQTDESLVKKSVEEGVVQNGANVRGLRVGIDISIWIYQACYHKQYTRNAALATLITKILRLFSMTAVIPLFVFDGPGRPLLKRGKRLRRPTHWIANDLKQFISAAGYKWIDAPGEAEAELSWLCRDNWIDTVLTEDADAVVFGAPKIVRILQADKAGIDVRSYNTFTKSREELILIAIFHGGDYSSGLPDCGIQTAMMLTKLKTSHILINAAASMDYGDLNNFVNGSWRKEFIAELGAHRLKRIRNIVVPLAFPSARVLHLYLFPVTSEPATPTILSWDTAPDLRKLATLMSTNLDSCNTFPKLLKQFDKTIFPGMAIRELLKIQLEHDNMLDNNIAPYHVLGLPAKPRRDQRHREATHVYVNLHIPVAAILEVIFGGSDGGIKQDYRQFVHGGARSVNVWLPRGLYEFVMKNHSDSDGDMELEETATILNDLDKTIDNIRDGLGLNNYGAGPRSVGSRSQINGSGTGTPHGRGPQPTNTIIIDDESDDESIIEISDTE